MIRGEIGGGEDMQFRACVRGKPGGAMSKLHSATILGFLLVALASAARAQSPPDVVKLAANVSKESQACIACHESGTAPLAVQQWAASRHAKVGIGC
jgi:hypothetical protein